MVYLNILIGFPTEKFIYLYHIPYDKVILFIGEEKMKNLNKDKKEDVHLEWEEMDSASPKEFDFVAFPLDD